MLNIPSDKAERSFSADSLYFPKKRFTLVCEFDLWKCLPSSPPQAVAQLQPKDPTTMSHLGRSRLLHGASFLSWSQVLRKGFTSCFFPFPNKNYPHSLDSFVTSVDTESHGRQPTYVSPRFCHRTKRRGLFELCAFWYILFVFQSLRNLGNLKDPFFSSPFGRHLRCFIKCSTPVP